MATKLGVGLPDDAVTVDDLADTIAKLIEEQERKTEVSKFRTDGWLKQFTVNKKETKTCWRDKRNISKSVVEEFSLGYDIHNDAATIPISAGFSWWYGVVRRFNGPDITNRYLNPTKFQKSDHVLFLERIDGSTVALTEGPIDALRCWTVGIPAVSGFGSSLSIKQVDLMKRWGVTTVVSFFDNDAPGKVGTMKNDQKFQGSGIMHYTADWGVYGSWSGNDPGDLTEHELKILFRDSVPFFSWQT